MPPVVAIVGHSNAGKTTLIEKLIPELRGRGYRVGAVKHAHHGFQMDIPGKDSWRHQAAGADTVMVVGPLQVAMVKNTTENSLESVLGYYGECDIVIAEGFKTARCPKVEVFRTGVNTMPACLNDPHLIGIVSDASPDADVPIIGLDDVSRLADLILGALLGSEPAPPLSASGPEGIHG